jgi:hypothetical protein
MPFLGVEHKQYVKPCETIHQLYPRYCIVLLHNDMHWSILKSSGWLYKLYTSYTTPYVCWILETTSQSFIAL